MTGGLDFQDNDGLMPWNWIDSMANEGVVKRPDYLHDRSATRSIFSNIAPSNSTDSEAYHTPLASRSTFKLTHGLTPLGNNGSYNSLSIPAHKEIGLFSYGFKRSLAMTGSKHSEAPFASQSITERLQVDDCHKFGRLHLHRLLLLKV